MRPGRNLGGGGRFAGTIYAHHRHHCKPFGLAMQIEGFLIESTDHFAARNGQYVETFFALRLITVFDRNKNTLGHWQTEVSADEGVLNFLESVVIELRRSGNDPVNLLGQLGLCALEARLEFTKQAHLHSHG